eukprot:SAG31_NODE_947_length_10828_cov_3.713953_11_plen_338_part_00
MQSSLKLSAIDPVISILLAVYVMLGCIISYGTSVEVTADGVLIILFVVAALVAFVCFLHQLGWLANTAHHESGRRMSDCERRLHSGTVWLRAQLKGTTAPGAVTADAIQMVNDYIEREDVDEYVGMDAGIVFLVFAQLLFATLIAYVTSVEVTVDGLLTFAFCATFGFFVLVAVRNAGWTLYEVGQTYICPSKFLEKIGAGFGQWCSAHSMTARRAGAYCRLFCMIALPIQLAVFPAVWILTNLGVVPDWVTTAARAEEQWALWVLAAVSVLGALVPVYRQHGPVIFCLTLWLLAVGSAVVFATAWIVEQPLLGGSAMLAICGGAITARRIAMKDEH